MEILLLAAVFLAVAFAPPLAFLVWLRNAEQHEREPMGQVLRVFVASAVLAVLAALVLGAIFQTGFEQPYEALSLAIPFTVVLAVVMAPITEEIAKVGAVLFAKDPHPEPEDGLVYGAAAGLGFAATENLLYEGVALATGGVGAYVTTAVVRAFASALLHASASAWAGYGLLAWRSGRRGPGYAAGFLLLAMVLHAAFNALASIGIVLAVVGAAALAIHAWRRVRRHALHLDAASAPPAVPPLP